MSPTAIQGHHRGVEAPLVSEVPVSETGGPDQVVGHEAAWQNCARRAEGADGVRHRRQPGLNPTSLSPKAIRN
jgi:hypothetical protein